MACSYVFHLKSNTIFNNKIILEKPRSRRFLAGVAATCVDGVQRTAAAKLLPDFFEGDTAASLAAALFDVHSPRRVLDGHLGAGIAPWFGNGLVRGRSVSAVDCRGGCKKASNNTGRSKKHGHFYRSAYDSVQSSCQRFLRLASAGRMRFDGGREKKLRSVTRCGCVVMRGRGGGGIEVTRSLARHVRD